MCLHLKGLGDELRDAVDEGSKGIVDQEELFDQLLNAFSARPLLVFPVLARAVHLGDQSVLAIGQSQQGHMGVVIDQGRDCMG